MLHSSRDAEDTGLALKVAAHNGWHSHSEQHARTLATGQRGKSGTWLLPDTSRSCACSWLHMVSSHSQSSSRACRVCGPPNTKMGRGMAAACTGTL